MTFTPRQGLRCRLEGIEPVEKKDSWPAEALVLLDKVLHAEDTCSVLLGFMDISAIFPVKVCFDAFLKSVRATTF